MAPEEEDPKDAKGKSISTAGTNKPPPKGLNILKLLRQAARYKAYLEIHGEQLEEHKAKLKNIRERHGIVTDEILPKMGLMFDSLQHQLEDMQLKADQLRHIRLEIERDQAEEKEKPETIIDEPPPLPIVLSPQTLDHMGLGDLSKLVGQQALKKYCEIIVIDTIASHSSWQSLFSKTPPDAPPPTQPPPSPIECAPAPSTPSADSSSRGTYKERQKERRKKNKAEKAKFQKELTLKIASSLGLIESPEVESPKSRPNSKLMKQKKLASKKVRKRLRARRIKENMMGKGMAKYTRDMLFEMGQAVRSAPHLRDWMRFMERFDMVSRWRLRTRPYAFF
ncbi:hypothetical protein F5Y11DRAFT_351718 [Daldinia sp. FL1419]|nr:hypothetical protein F5Y11DRAFT_351718 [Daldinia sp. FL1419]